MCGIFGYVGTRTAEPILLEGLRTLEYRGYDSAGIFIPGHGAMKAVGPIDALAGKLQQTRSGTAGIAHTRWATHGAPTEANAHPHASADKSIWLVHNGIIENYQELKANLQAAGCTFFSETDSEVLAQLIGQERRSGEPLRETLGRVLPRVRGAYGLAAMADDTPEEIVVARLGSPIVLGVAPDGHLVSSDPSALLAHTKDVVYLEDGEIAVMTPAGYEVVTTTGKAQPKRAETIEWDVESVKKQGYEHFMLKEIMEAPEVVENTIRGRLIPRLGKAKLGGLEPVLGEVCKLDRLTITACGTAYLAGAMGKHLLEQYARLPVELEFAHEYRYKTNLPDKHSALLAVTQSGETADTLAAVRLANEMNILTLGMVNVVGSSVARETKAGMYNHAGPEVAVASTKVFVSQLVSFVLLALLIGRENGLPPAAGKAIIKDLQALPDVLRRQLATAAEIEAIATRYAGYRNAMFIGRTTHAPIAHEGALKLKEISYLHAEAYAAGELKHGSIALLDEQFPVIALAPQDAQTYEKMLSNIEEVKARGAPVLAIANEGDSRIGQLADEVIYVPTVHPALQPIVSTIPLHLLAYYVGVAKGYNVDRPRNLAKSVTVE